MNLNSHTSWLRAATAHNRTGGALVFLHAEVIGFDIGHLDAPEAIPCGAMRCAVDPVNVFGDPAWGATISVYRL